MAGPPCLQTGVVARESQRGGRGDGYDSLGLKHSYRQSATVTEEKNVQGGFTAGLLLTPPPFHQVITTQPLFYYYFQVTNQPANQLGNCERMMLVFHPVKVSCRLVLDHRPNPFCLGLTRGREGRKQRQSWLQWVRWAPAAPPAGSPPPGQHYHYLVI